MSPDEAKRREEAVAWFAALRAGVMQVEQRQAYDAWRADPQNQSALDAVHEKWGELAALKDMTPRLRLLDRPSGRLAAIAAVVVACLGAGLMWSMVARPDAISTAVGEQKIQSLPDGSVIAVNVVSRLSYQLETNSRIVDLAEGEAAFTVRADPDRPFIVKSAGYEVRATGTSFNIRRRGDSLAVSVREGTVEVCAMVGDRAGETLFTLEAGQLIHLPANPSGHSLDLPLPQRLPPEHVAEWRDRVVTYEDVSLATIVDDVNRYFERKLILADRSDGDRRVTIRLQVDNRDAALGTLASLLGGRIRAGDKEDILVD